MEFVFPLEEFGEAACAGAEMESPVDDFGHSIDLETGFTSTTQ